MLGILVFAGSFALTPTQSGALNLTNVRTTYGELGAVRTNDNYLQGDVYFLAFDIEGITVGADGKVSYAMSVEATDKSGKAIFKQDKPVERDEFLPLGGNRLPGRAFLGLKLDQEPGPYTCKVTVIDRANKATKVLERQFHVIKKELGLIGLYLTYDKDGAMPAPPSGVVGQNLNIHGAVIGFGRGPDKKPNATIELRLFDENKRPTVAKPQSASVPKEVPEGEEFAVFWFLVPLNREGSFTAEIKVTDTTTGKSANVTFPIRVNAPAK